MANGKGKNVMAQRGDQMESMPLGKINYIAMFISLLLIVVGLWMMTGSANVGDTFNSAIFEPRRTVVGPMIALLGFVLMAPAILLRKKTKNDDSATGDA